MPMILFNNYLQSKNRKNSKKAYRGKQILKTIQFLSFNFKAKNIAGKFEYSKDELSL